MNYILSQDQYNFLKENKYSLLQSTKNSNIFIVNQKFYSKANGSEIITESVSGLLGNIGDWANMGIESISDMVDGWDVKDWAHLSVDVLASILGVVFPGIGDKVVEFAHIIWWGFEYYDADKTNNDPVKTEAALNMAAISMLGLIFPIAGAAAMATLKGPFKIISKALSGFSKFAGKGVAKQEVKYVVKQTVGKESVTHYMTKAELNAFAKAEPQLYKDAIREGNVIGNFFKKFGKKIGPDTVQNVEVKTLGILDKCKKSLGNSTFAKPLKFFITVLDYLMSSLKSIFSTFSLMLILIGRTSAVDILDQEYLGNSIEDLTHAGVESVIGSKNSRSALLLPILYKDNVNFKDGVYLITIRLNSFEDLKTLTNEQANNPAPGNEKNLRYYYVVGSSSNDIPVYQIYAYNEVTKDMYAGFVDNEGNANWKTPKELAEFTGKEYNYEFVPVDSLPTDDKAQYKHVRKLIGSIDKDKIRKFSNFRKALKDVGIEHPGLTGDYYKLPEISAYKKSIVRKAKKK